MTYLFSLIIFLNINVVGTENLDELSFSCENLVPSDVRLKMVSWCRRLPPHATTAVRCELLPLTSGIITLDTLHIATNEHGNKFYFLYCVLLSGMLAFFVHVRVVKC